MKTTAQIMTITLSATLFGLWMALYSPTASAEWFDPHMYVFGGIGGCNTSAGEMRACDVGVTNQGGIELQWYESDGLSVYSDWRHTSRIDIPEDFDPDVRGGSGQQNNWCYLCLRYKIF